MADATCKTCRWYTDPDGGVCRLLPPRVGFDVDSPKALPRVDGDEELFILATEPDADLIARAPADLAALVAEVRRLREAAAAPLVHLAAGQVAVWPWQPTEDADVSAYAVAIDRDWCLVARPTGYWHVEVMGTFDDDPVAFGIAPDIAAAKLAAEAAVAELAPNWVRESMPASRACSRKQTAWPSGCSTGRA